MGQRDMAESSRTEWEPINMFDIEKQALEAVSFRVQSTFERLKEASVQLLPFKRRCKLLGLRYFWLLDAGISAGSEVLFSCTSSEGFPLEIRQSTQVLRFYCSSLTQRAPYCVPFPCDLLSLGNSIFLVTRWWPLIRWDLEFSYLLNKHNHLDTVSQPCLYCAKLS